MWSKMRLILRFLQVWFTMRSTNVDQVIPKMKRILLWLFGTKSMTFRRSKTVSNIFIGFLIASDEINNLCDFLDFVGKLWILPQTQKMLISLEAMKHLMKMFDTVLERIKVILWVPESHMNTLFILGNTWSTFMDRICEPKCVEIWVLVAHLTTCSSSGWVIMTNIFSELKNMNHQFSNALSTILIRRLAMFLHFDTYAFESAQKVMSCMIPIYQSGFLAQNVDFYQKWWGIIWGCSTRIWNTKRSYF